MASSSISTIQVAAVASSKLLLSAMLFDGHVLDFHVIIQQSIIKCTRAALYAHICSTYLYVRVKVTAYRYVELARHTGMSNMYARVKSA
jgi:hypothetical protein